MEQAFHPRKIVLSQFHSVVFFGLLQILTNKIVPTWLFEAEGGLEMLEKVNYFLIPRIGFQF